MENKKVRVGIIGLGFMGSTHYHIYKEHPKAEVVAIADIDDKKRQGDWSGIIGNIGGFDNSNIDMSSYDIYKNALDLINSDKVDLVDICLPTYLHKDYALAALNSGKHLHLEKPIARDLEEAKEIIECARKNKGFFSLGMCVRYWPQYAHARDLYHSGSLGKVKSATFKRISPSVHGNAWEDWFMDSSKSGGALLDLHLHDADQVLTFFGRPQKVNAFGLKAHRTDSGVDHSFTRYDYGDGTFIMSEGGWNAGKNSEFEMSFQIVCEKATISFNSNGYKVFWEDGKIDEPALAETTGWHNEIDIFLKNNISGNNQLKINQQEMLDGISLIEAEQLSIDKEEAVMVEYV